MKLRSLWLVALLVLGCSSWYGAGSLSDHELRRASTHRERAALKLSEGQIEMAIREYRNSLELNPYDAETHFGYAEALRMKGRGEEAMQVLLKALEIDPSHGDARLNLCGLYLDVARWPDAIREATTLIEDPTFLNPARAYVNRGWAYYSSGEPSKAEADLREALAIDGSLFQAHLNLGILLYERGETVEAMKTFDRVLQILSKPGRRPVVPAEAETRFRLAQAHVKLGQREKALEQLRLAAAQENAAPWSDRAREYLAMLE